MKDIAILLHATAGLLRRRFERAARPMGLTLLQWRALALLGQDGPKRQVAIGEALEASPMAISDLAERLEASGLAVRAPDPDDSRAKTLALTDEGARMLGRMRTVSEDVFAEVFADIGADDAAVVRRVLGQLKANLGGARAAPGAEGATEDQTG